MSQFEYIEIFYAVHIFPSEDTITNTLHVFYGFFLYPLSFRLYPLSSHEHVITNTLATATAPFQPFKRCVPCKSFRTGARSKEDRLGGKTLHVLRILKTSKWRQSA
jgi:hypothetical protein